MYRTFGDERLRELARAATVPVINGLSDGGHPVQLLADLFTVEERLGALGGKVVAWVGDGGSNMALSWIEAAALFGFTLRISAPEGFRPARGSGFELVAGAREAVRGADVVTTDVWISMGQEKEAAARRKAFAGYCLDEALLARAKPSAIVLHCLPAHRGEEISAGVIDGPQSAVLDEAENRMHVQKALLEALILRR
jgi:ornithine carbamoyltransferase